MSIIADIFGAKSADRGQERAAEAATSATQASLAEQRRQYDLSRADMQPWLQTGSGALGQLARLYGIGQGGQPAPRGGTASYGGVGVSNGGVQMPQTGGAQGGQYDTFWQSPDYQFRLNESQRALTARNAALGIQDSGAAQRSALQYAGNLASGEFNNYANRLAGLAGVGQTAAQGNAQLGQNYAGAVTGINQNQANALGSSYINRGNIWGNLINNWTGQATRAAGAFLGG